MTVLARCLGVRAPGCPELFEEPLPEPENGQFLVETLYSGISAGTELTFVKGTNPFLHASWDPEVGVFRHDRPATGYPVKRLGYMEVGRVAQSRWPGIEAGRRVAMTYGHRSHHVADPLTERVVPLPENLEPLLGIYAAHMGPICANGLLHAAAEEHGRSVQKLGDGVRDRTVLVYGAGVVGLLVALLADHHGAADVIVCDPTPQRLVAARELGVGALDDSQAEAWETVKDRWRHGARDRGADVVFQCRGQPRALAAALRCLRPQGTVIDLAFYPGGSPELRLGEEFHHNGLGIRCAQIGRVPRGLGDHWDRDRLSSETIELLAARGDDIARVLVSDLVPEREGVTLLRDLAERRRQVLQAVLAYPPGA